MNQYHAIPVIARHIIDHYHPRKLMLFGSCARRAVRKNSDIDLCLVIDTADKRGLRAAITQDLLSLSDYDVDLIIMTPREWERDAGNTATLASIIKQKGVSLHG